jgi:hypothetical protein
VTRNIRIALPAIAAVLGTSLAGAEARAQGAVTQPILSLATATLVAAAALSECTSRGFHTSVAVIDRAGNLLVLLRD